MGEYPPMINDVRRIIEKAGMEPDSDKTALLDILPGLTLTPDTMIISKVFTISVQKNLHRIG